MERLGPTHRILALALLLGAAPQVPAQAGAGEPPPETPEPPPLPPKVKTGEQIDDPVVTIRTDDDGQVIEEYFQNGRIFMVKVTPENAPPYYLYDLDGDGLFEDMNPQTPVKPVHWKLAEWQ